jgi:hypothetical protein
MERALAWFLSFVEQREWRQRVDRIEEQLSAVHRPHASRADAIKHGSVSIADDRVAWYLYLVDTALHDCVKYEPIQGSRVVPIFARFGHDLALLQSIGGIEARIARMLGGERGQADSALFELLIALLWARNGCERVEFIAEQPPERRPDIRALKNGEEWFVECKRLQKSSQYSDEERNKWLNMWVPFRDFLIESRTSAVFDIVFHVELGSLADDFLVAQLAGKLPLIQLPCTLISNDTWEISAKPVDYETATAHLKKYLVRYPSDQIQELVAGRRDPSRGFTSVVLGHFVTLGEGRGNNRFLDELAFAAGAFWNCDNPQVIARKARDIRGHLSNAVRQLPAAGKSAVHVALETLDGPDVEEERLLRMLRSVMQFDAAGKDLRWVYCHMFQSYAPPDEMWVIDETVHHFGRQDCRDEPLTARAAILPEGADSRQGVHWRRDAP